MYERIALIKTAWSDEYRGGPVVGRYAHVTKFEDAHERFNFLKADDGKFYGYAPPIGKQMRPPQPKVSNDWLILFVSAKNGNGPLTVVGWYKNAKFENEYQDRPEYASAEDFETDVQGVKYVYCVTSKDAHLIKPLERINSVSGDHFKRSPILYLRGNGKNEAWRKELAIFAENLVGEFPTNMNEPQPNLTFPDAAHRKMVEIAAINAAKNFLMQTHRVTDRQKDNCGYDLLARHRKNLDELHVEVKGTSANLAHFYMSRNEFRYMPNPKWRLIIVTNALSTPIVNMMTLREVKQQFNLDPFAWEAMLKKNEV